MRRESCAVGALFGSPCVVLGDALAWPATPTAISGASFCVVLRHLAIRRSWQLPVAGSQRDR